MGIKPMGTNAIRPHFSSMQIGACVGANCRRGIFSHQEYVRLRKPAYGMCHVECVPEGAVVVEAVSP